MHSWLYCIGLAVATIGGGLGAFALVVWLLSYLWTVLEERYNDTVAAFVCLFVPIFLALVTLVALTCRGILH